MEERIEGKAKKQHAVEFGAGSNANDDEGGRWEESSTKAPPATTDGVGLFLLPIELLERICSILDYDSLAIVVSVSRKMHTVAAPLFRKIRIQVQDDIVGRSTFIAAKNILNRKGKYLKEVLRTNEQLSKAAIDHRDHQRKKKRKEEEGAKEKDEEEEKMQKRPRKLRRRTNWMDKLDLEKLDRRAADLAEIAMDHLWLFPRPPLYGYGGDVRIVIGQIAVISLSAYTRLYNCLLFKDFIRKNTILSGFTSVQWPEGMDEDERKQIIMEFAERGNERNTPNGKSQVQEDASESTSSAMSPSSSSSRQRYHRRIHYWDRHT